MSEPGADERAIFDRAIDLPPGRRPAYLDHACAGDHALRARIDALLAAHEHSGFLASPTSPVHGAPDPAPDAPPDTPPDATAPPGSDPTADLPDPGPAGPRRRIAGFTILRPLGTGGMGSVYLARQDKPDRRIALKVITSPFANRTLLRRFELEAELLARLQHPGIAQIYEAGTYDVGGQPRPYFAMEYVKGRPLDQYAAAMKLTTRQRLDLAAKICDAVQHAHQKGVVHRDLKPGNILVTEDGQPKILDFGVARATDSDLRTTTLQTDIGQIIGTLPYMSPEQVGGDPEELDTRSDVYALGVVIYELLAGKLPYALEKKLIHEAARIIREQEPTRLSAVSRVFRGDVETIVAKALEKEKARRYQSANALAADIRHYLSDEPIAARPAGTWYQLAKFTRRNRPLVAGVAAAFLFLAAGVIGTSIMLARALNAEARERHRAQETELARKDAERQRDLMLAHNRFVQSMLESANPETPGGGRQVTVASLLDAAAARVGVEFADSPDAEHSIRAMLASSYASLELNSDAAAQWEAVIPLGERVFGPDSPEVLRAKTSLGTACSWLGRPDDAERLHRYVLDARTRLLGPDAPETARSLCNLGSLLADRGRLDEAEPLLRRAIEALQRAGLEREREGLIAEVELGNVFLARGRFPEAVPLLTRAIEGFVRLKGTDHPDTQKARSSLLMCYMNSAGNLDKAAALLADLIDVQCRVYGEESPPALQMMSNRAALNMKLGRFEAAEEESRRVWEIKQRVLGPAHESTLNSLNGLGYALMQQGRNAEAEPYLRQAVEDGDAALPGGSPRVEGFRAAYGQCLSRLGHHAQAQAHLQRAFDSLNASLGPLSPYTFATADALAELYENWDAAEPNAGHGERGREWRAKMNAWVDEAERQRNAATSKPVPPAGGG